MSCYKIKGQQIRLMAKELVYDFMKSELKCQPNSEGMRLASIFRECGFDWGNYEKATSTNQQYWVVAIVRELEKEGLVERIGEKGPWRLR